jgi:hypothetical protein
MSAVTSTHWTISWYASCCLPCKHTQEAHTHIRCSAGALVRAETRMHARARQPYGSTSSSTSTGANQLQHQHSPPAAGPSISPWPRHGDPAAAGWWRPWLAGGSHQTRAAVGWREERAAGWLVGGWLRRVAEHVVLLHKQASAGLASMQSTHCHHSLHATAPTTGVTLAAVSNRHIFRQNSTYGASKPLCSHGRSLLASTWAAPQAPLLAGGNDGHQCVRNAQRRRRRRTPPLMAGANDSK